MSFLNITYISNVTIAEFSLSEEEWHHRILGTSLVGSINFIGFVLSVLILFLTFTQELKMSKVNLMLGNLTFSTLLHTSMFVGPQNLFALYRERLSKEACSWLGYFFFVVAVQKMQFPPFLAINRHTALMSSEKYNRIYTTRNIILQILLSWFISAMIPLPFALAGKTGFDADNSHCCIVVKDSFWWTAYYAFVVIVPLVVVCDGAMFYWNYKIYKKLYDHTLNRSLSKNVMSQNRELFYFMIADTVIPLAFYTFYHITKVFYINRQNTTLKIFLPSFYSTAAVVRCLCILILLRPYRRALRNLFCCGRGRTRISPLTMAGLSTVAAPGHTGWVKRRQMYPDESYGTKQTDRD